MASILVNVGNQTACSSAYTKQSWMLGYEYHFSMVSGFNSEVLKKLHTYIYLSPHDKVDRGKRDQKALLLLNQLEEDGGVKFVMKK